MSAYAELHACSAFSFLRGANFPEDLAKRAAQLELPAVALLDRNGVYGAQRFSAACREHGVRPITGSCLTMEDGSLLPVLVENRTGYKNLCGLLTEAHLRSEKGTCEVRWNEVAEFREGLITLLVNECSAVRLLELFGRERVYVELQRHFVRGEERTNRALIDLAEHYRLPLLATNGVQHATPAGREVLDVFTCIREHTHLDAAGKLLTQNAERHLKSDAEMRAAVSRSAGCDNEHGAPGGTPRVLARKHRLRISGFPGAGWAQHGFVPAHDRALRRAAALRRDQHAK